MEVCAVIGCDSWSEINTNFTFHRLPPAPQVRARWLAALGRSPGAVGACAHVCSRHFQDSMFTGRGNERFLAKDAVPTLFLPSQSESKLYEEADSELLACRVCLAVDGRLQPISGSGFEDTLAELTGVPLSVEGFPRHLCVFCRARLSKCAAFRDSCQRSAALLQTLLDRGPLTMNDIKAIDRQSHELTNGLTRETVVHFKPIKMEDNKTSAQVDTSLNYTDAVYLEIDERSFVYDANTDFTDETEVIVKVENVKSEDEKLTDSEDDKRKTAYAGTLKKKENVKETIKSQHRTVSDSLKLKREVSTKTTKKGTGNTVYKNKRKRIGDVYPVFNFEAFEKEFNVKIKFLTKEEQVQEIQKKIKTSQSNYCCGICGKEFQIEKTMKKHLLCHDPSTGPVECEICHCRFGPKTEFRLRRHLDTHRIKFTCRVCGSVSRDKTNAKLHSLVHSGKTYACPHCEQVYKHRTSYLNHMREQHPAQNVACDQCGETFLSEKGVHQHKVRAHRNPKPQLDFKCSVCEFSFSSAEALDRHTQSGAGAAHALWPCAACGESCASDAARAAHAAETHPPGQLHCQECSVTFSSAASFALHTRRKHLGVTGHGARRSRPRRAGPAPRVVCDVCGRTIQSEAALKFHLYTHMDQKPYACPLCPKTFAAKNARELHIRSHTGERPYQCAHCALAFALKSNLVRHMERVHLRRTREFPCDVCLKAFTTPWSVKLHVRTVHSHMPAPRRLRRPRAADN